MSGLARFKQITQNLKIMIRTAGFYLMFVNSRKSNATVLILLHNYIHSIFKQSGLYYDRNLRGFEDSQPDYATVIVCCLSICQAVTLCSTNPTL
jgi:hypothetical protein